MRRTIKTSEHSYYSLFSNKYSSQTIGTWRWRPGPDDVIKKSRNSLQLWRHPQKPKTFHFLI